MDVTRDGTEVMGTGDTMGHDCPALCLCLPCCLLKKLLTSFPKFSNVVPVCLLGVTVLTVTVCHVCSKAFEG